MERKQLTRCNEVWNWIKDEVNKSRTDEEVVIYSIKTKLEIQKKPAKEPRKKKLTEGSPVFLTYNELRSCWDIEMSWKFGSFNKLDLIIEKLKQTATMNCLHLMK